MKSPLAASVLVLLLAGVAMAGVPPSQPGVDAPALAPLGPDAVGTRTLELVQHEQPDLAATIEAGGNVVSNDRKIGVELWYPATRPAGKVPETYHGALTSEHGPKVSFSVPGLALRDAPPSPGRHPLVVVSHGLGNDPMAMTWLTENLASKGYVVAAIRHDDPPYGDRATLPTAVLRRPQDIAFVVASLQDSLGKEGLIDPDNVALAGYSAGGYGVLTVAGAEIDPATAAAIVPASLMVPFAAGGARVGELRIRGLRALVGISPVAGGARQIFTPASIASLSVPMLLIVGDDDRSVGYATGVRALYEATNAADRYLLTFHYAGHGIGLNPAPEEMRASLWDLDWFEDPVWRKDRIIAINLHFITAFLDGIFRHDEDHRSYLDVSQPESTAGSWPAPGPAHWSDLSPGGAGNGVWKGFPNRHVAGLELEHRAPEAR